MSIRTCYLNIIGTDVVLTTAQSQNTLHIPCSKDIYLSEYKFEDLVDFFRQEIQDCNRNSISTSGNFHLSYIWYIENEKALALQFPCLLSAGSFKNNIKYYKLENYGTLQSALDATGAVSLKTQGIDHTGTFFLIRSQISRTKSQLTVAQHVNSALETIYLDVVKYPRPSNETLETLASANFGPMFSLVKSYSNSISKFVVQLPVEGAFTSLCNPFVAINKIDDGRGCLYMSLYKTPTGHHLPGSTILTKINNEFFIQMQTGIITSMNYGSISMTPSMSNNSLHCEVCYATVALSTNVSINSICLFIVYNNLGKKYCCYPKYPLSGQEVYYKKQLVNCQYSTTNPLGLKTSDLVRIAIIQDELHGFKLRKVGSSVNTQFLSIYSNGSGIYSYVKNGGVTVNEGDLFDLEDNLLIKTTISTFGPIESDQPQGDIKSVDIPSYRNRYIAIKLSTNYAPYTYLSYIDSPSIDMIVFPTSSIQYQTTNPFVAYNECFLIRLVDMNALTAMGYDLFMSGKFVASRTSKIFGSSGRYIPGTYTITYKTITSKASTNECYYSTQVLSGMKHNNITSTNYFSKFQQNVTGVYTSSKFTAPPTQTDGFFCCLEASMCTSIELYIKLV